MPAVSEDLVRELAVISQGRALTWAERSYDAATLPIEGPEDADAFSLALAKGTKTATKAFLRIRLREDGWRKTSRNDLGVYDAATTYGATINGTAHTAVAEGSEAATLQELADDINAGAENGVVEAAVEDGKLVIQGIVEDDFTILYTLSGGTGTWTSGTAGLTDATTVEWRAWGIPVDDTEVGPDVIDGMTPQEETANCIRELTTRGLAYVGIQIVSTDGLVTVKLGIGDLES